MISVDEMSCVDEWAAAGATTRSLADLTAAGVGGITRRFFEPRSPEEVSWLVRRTRARGLPVFILGGGTNVLVEDGELPGAVMSTRRLCRVRWLEDRVCAEAGASLPGLVHRTASLGMAGLEPLSGIPGTVGGAVFGNAGGRLGNIGDALLAARVVDPDGRIRWIGREVVNPTYRNTDLDGFVILEVVLGLQGSPAERVRQRIAEIQAERRGRQPRDGGSMGCVFKNPRGASAGMLIDRAGLKGTRIGGVRVSRKHANFFVNGGYGTASDFLALAGKVRRTVEARFSIRLEPEVRIWRCASLDDSGGGRESRKSSGMPVDDRQKNDRENSCAGKAV